MRKIVMLLFCMLLSTVIWAVKAYHKPVTITQSDGTRLTVIGHGDENFSYYTTTDGILLFHEGKNFFIAGMEADGTFINTEILAHEADCRTELEKTLINKQDRSLFLSFAQSQAHKARIMREPVKNDHTLFPHTGTPKVLVILAEFSDVKFTVNEPKKAFEQYLNAEDKLENLGNHDTSNIGSVRKYFTDMSFGQFQPQFDVYGPITLDKPLEYYGANTDYTKDNMKVFIPDVCKAVDNDVDFSEYDQNGDGYVDLVYVIYAGYSESFDGNSSYCIWPKSGATSYGGQYDGVTVYRYGVNNELNGVEGEQTGYINGIGLFCHEFSHCMGMPDLYTTTAAPQETQNANNQEMEYWSIMDSGTYIANGYRPAAYTAWEREVFGWFEIETLQSKGIFELKPIDEGGKAYRIKNDNDVSGKEYYILENIQQRGYNVSQLGHGMLAIHVDYNENIFSLSNNSVNNTLGHPRMTVLAADGLLLNSIYRGYDENGKWVEDATYFNKEAAGDPFPGTSNVHELTDKTPVRPIVYNGTALNKPIYDIQEDENGIITFKFLDPTVTGIKDAIVENYNADNSRIYTLDGRYAGTHKDNLRKGIYIINNKKVIIQ